MLSTSPIALALVAVNITKQKTILLDFLITLGEGDNYKASAFRNVIRRVLEFTESTTVRKREL